MFQTLDYLGPVVRRVDNAIHWINHYPLDSAVFFVSTYPLDSDLSGGKHYPPFEQPGPVFQEFCIEIAWLVVAETEFI